MLTNLTDKFLVFSNAAVGTGGNRRCDGASATCRIPDHLDCGARS